MEEDEVKIKLVSDTTGADKARKSLQGVGKDAKDASVVASRSLGGLQKTFEGMRQNVTKLKEAIAGLGGVTTVIAGAVKAFKEWRAAAREVAAEIDKCKADAAVATLAQIAEAEQKIAKSLAEQNEARANAGQLDRQRLSNARALEDANLRNAELDELDKVGESPDKDLQEQRIRNKYKRLRGEMQTSRTEEDIRKGAADKIAEAEKLEATAAEMDRLQAEAADQARTESRNSAKKAAAAVKASRSDAWWKFWSDGADESEMLQGEASRHGSAAKSATAQAESLKEQSAAATRKARLLREQANADLGSLDALNANATADAKESAMAVQTVEDTQKQRNDKRAAVQAQIAADQATVAAGTKQIAGLEAQATTEEARALAAARRYDSEQSDVFAAQNRYDMTVANGGSRKDRSEALAALQREKEEALAAQHEMERVSADVANVLAGIRSEINALSNAMKAAQGRLKQNQADAPEG